METPTTTTTTAPSVDWFDLFAPAFHLDPYPFYHRLRNEDPVHWGMSFEPGIAGMWHIARHADIMRILKDQRFVHRLPDDDRTASQAALPDAVQLYLSLTSQSLLFADPPAHTRLRNLVSSAFTPRQIEKLRPRVQAVADELLDAADAQGQLDVINDYALPLTTTIISEMLGVRVDSREQLIRWARVLVQALDCKQSPEIYLAASQVALEIYPFFQQIIEERRQALRDDILSGLIQAQDQRDQLSEPELIVTLTTLFIAGHETTVNLIGNGMLALMRFPDQFALLCAQPDLMPSAVEEFLRYDASSQMTSRVASEDIEVSGKVIQRGQTLNLLLSSGNHDPDVFPDPERLDITRRENRHLTFGMGMHYCLGAPLARLEGQVAIQSLLRRHPHLRMLDETPQWRDTISFRGLQRLPLAFV